MRRVGADKIFKRFQKAAITLYEKNTTRYQMVMDILDGIKNAPTIDAVEVVRCKDCKKWDAFADGLDSAGYCYKWHDNVQSDGYCYYGERKETAE